MFCTSIAQPDGANTHCSFEHGADTWTSLCGRQTRETASFKSAAAEPNRRSRPRHPLCAHFLYWTVASQRMSDREKLEGHRETETNTRKHWQTRTHTTHFGSSRGYHWISVVWVVFRFFCTGTSFISHVLGLWSKTMAISAITVVQNAPLGCVTFLHLLVGTVVGSLQVFTCRTPILSQSTLGFVVLAIPITLVNFRVLSGALLFWVDAAFFFSSHRGSFWYRQVFGPCPRNSLSQMSRRTPSDLCSSLASGTTLGETVITEQDRKHPSLFPHIPKNDRRRRHYSSSLSS